MTTATVATGATPRQRRAVDLLTKGYTKRQVMSELGVDEPWLAEAVTIVTGAPAQTATPSRPVAATAPVPAPVAAAVPTPPPAEPTRDAIGTMLARADDSTSRAAKRTADRIRALIATLREQLEETAEADRVAKERAEEKARLAEQIAAARRALDEANAKLKALGGKTTRAATAPRAASDAAVIRAWARENGVDCPDRGRIPAPVREQYEAAK